jgi:hypothetical protein
MRLPRFRALAAALALATAPLAAPLAAADSKAPIVQDDGNGYEQIVSSVSNMVSDGDATRMVAAKGLDLVNVMWEDTGRYEGSSVGPNISDVTIEVQGGGGKGDRSTYLMPVIRNSDFSDKTADVAIDRIYVPVGNQYGGKLRTITLKDFLADPLRYLSLPHKGGIKGGSLLAKRDTHALVSAQHAFLPVPKDGKATFWPVIFNYVSSQKNPGVLTLLVTRQGTSATIIDNTRDTLTGEGSWGQRLYFNKDGKRAPLIAERLKDVKSKGYTANGEDAAMLGDDANLLMLIQIPLKQKEVRRPMYKAEDMDGADDEGYGAGDAKATAPSAATGAASGGGMAARGRSSDVDTAVLGQGPTEGPYTELDGLTIERDPRFPVRVTVQFYQATSNGVVSQDDIDRMSAQIDKVYAKGDYVGSLVVPGPNDKMRPTRWDGAGPMPPDVAWNFFGGLVERYQIYGFIGIPFANATVGNVPADPARPDDDQVAK